MSAYYVHDGRNELGPFPLDLLRKQKLTRNTPVRLDGTDSWMPAEGLAELKSQVVPLKIKRPKDIVPVMTQRVTDFRRERPKTAYAAMLVLALLSGVSIYSVSKKSPASAASDTTIANGAEASENPTAVGALWSQKRDGAAPTGEEAAKKKEARQQWQKLFRVSSSNYGIGVLGGIKNLEVTVANGSDYPVDEAVAKVTYYKANGEVWKSKTVTVRGIQTHNSKSQSVADVMRGKKVSVALQKLVSRQMNFSYTAGKKGTDSDDPYVLK